MTEDLPHGEYKVRLVDSRIEVTSEGTFAVLEYEVLEPAIYRGKLIRTYRKFFEEVKHNGKSQVRRPS